MPAHFGGSPFYPTKSSVWRYVRYLRQYETDQMHFCNTYLKDFELKEPVVSVQYTNCRDVVWMSGGEYQLIQVSAQLNIWEF